MAKKSKKRLKLKKGPVIVLVLLILLLVGSIFYFYTHTSKYLFFKNLDKSYDNLITTYDTFIEKYLPYINSNYHNQTNTSYLLKTSNENQNVKLNGNVYLDNFNYYYDLDINNGTKSYDFEMLSKNNNLYYKIDDSKYYSMPFKVDSYDYAAPYQKLLAYFSASLKENVKSSDFNKSSENININSKIYNTKKITLVIRKKSYYEIIKTFYEKIKKDDDVINYLLTKSDFSSKDTFIKSMDLLINLYKDNDKDNNDIVLRYSLYIYKSKPIKSDIRISLGDNYQLSYIDYADYLEIDYKEKDGQTSYIKLSDKKIEMFVDGLGYGNGSYSDNAIDINFSDYNKKSLGYLKYSVRDKYTTNIDINISLDNFILVVSSNNKIELDKKMPDVDVSGSVSNNIVDSDKIKLNEVITLLNDIFMF